MACQILTASLAEVARPSGALAELARPSGAIAEMARPQSTGICQVYDLGHFIYTLVDQVPIVTFDNQNLALL